MVKIFETRRLIFQYSSMPRGFKDFMTWIDASAIGFLVALSLWMWFGVRENKSLMSMRSFFNEKMLKYIPIDYGGNFFFPFSGISVIPNKVYPKTQWSSFDKRAFFPHTDVFKAKVAIAHEDYNLLNVLLQRNFDINSVIDERKKMTPIALASLLGKTELVEYLFARGADLEAKDFEENTPLMLAVVSDHPKTVKKLIDLGADLDAKDSYGFTAQEKAENRGKQDLAEFISKSNQKVPVPVVKPFTFRLENYEVITSNNSKEIIKKYDIERYFKPQIYPYYKTTKGFLAYMFPAVDREDIELHASASVYFNESDDKITSDQNLFTFGEVLREKNS
jgi:hypothetical protein